jgi:hypothetical protein
MQLLQTLRLQEVLNKAAVFPLPEESADLAPLPSEKAHDPARPEEVSALTRAFVMVKETVVDAELDDALPATVMG